MRFLREVVKNDAETRRKADEALQRLQRITDRLEIAVAEAEGLLHDDQ